MIYEISPSMKEVSNDSPKNHPPPEGGSGFFYGYFVWGIVIDHVDMWGGYYAFGVFFKPVLDEFGWTKAMTSRSFSLASIMNGLLTIERGGLRISLVLGWLCSLRFVLGSGLC